MNTSPSNRNRTAEEITGENLYFDSVGYLYRAVSWLDHFERTPRFTSLLYACIEGRMGIEYLLFEELVISTGAKLSREDYGRCLKNRKSFAKLIRQLSPDHEKAQQFTHAILEIEPGAPTLVFWSPRELEKVWGKLSKYVHWTGARTETTEDPDWRKRVAQDVKEVLLPIWENMSSGQSGLLHPTNMKSHVREVWDDFKNDSIDINSVKVRLQLIRPIYA